MSLATSSSQACACHAHEAHPQALLGHGGEAAGEGAVAEQVPRALVRAGVLQQRAHEAQLLPRQAAVLQLLQQLRQLRLPLALIAQREEHHQPHPAHAMLTLCMHALQHA